MNRKEPAILDHEYDGIREYDNPTPGWWHFIFLGTIVFTAFYITFWHFSPLATSIHEAWDQDQVADYKRIFGSVGELRADDTTILQMASNDQMMAVARSLYIGNCALCHGRDGGGINGVNLTDDHYKNVKKLDDIFHVITNGANLGAMPAWGQKLSPNERVILSSYILTLRGTNVPGRAPEGEVIPPFPEVSAPPTPSR